MRGNENQTVRQNQEELVHGSIIRSYTNSVVLIRAIFFLKGEMISYKIHIPYLIKTEQLSRIRAVFLDSK